MSDKRKIGKIRKTMHKTYIHMLCETYDSVKRGKKAATWQLVTPHEPISSALYMVGTVHPALRNIMMQATLPQTSGDSSGKRSAIAQPFQ
jgi:hypothetical protein